MPVLAVVIVGEVVVLMFVGSSSSSSSRRSRRCSGSRKCNSRSPSSSVSSRLSFTHDGGAWGVGRWAARQLAYASSPAQEILAGGAGLSPLSPPDAHPTRRRHPHGGSIFSCRSVAAAAVVISR